MSPMRTSILLTLFWTSCAAYFLNDQNNTVYFFNGEKNVDTWTNAKTVCNLLGADLVTLTGDEAAFLGVLRDQKLWSSIRTDPNDVSKYILPDGSPYEASFPCSSSECCALYMSGEALNAAACDSKNPYICKFMESFTELKPKFDMIDTIRSQLEDFNKTMEDYYVRMTSIEEGQGNLELKLESYNKTLSDDINKTSKLADDIAAMANNLAKKQEEIIDGTATKLVELEQKVDEKLDTLKLEQENRVEDLRKQQELLSSSVKLVQGKVDNGQTEMLDAINVMNETIAQQSTSMHQKLEELMSGLTSLQEKVGLQVKEIEAKFDANLTAAKETIEKTIANLEEHITKTDDFMTRIHEVRDSLDSQFNTTKLLISETDGRVKELDERTNEAKKLLDAKQIALQQTMIYVNNTLESFRGNIAADESSLKTLKTATYTMLGLLIVAILIQYAYIFRHKLAKLNPGNRSANIDS